MALVDVEEISLVAADDERLYGCYLDANASTGEADTYVLHIQGWVLGRNNPAVKVEFVYDEMIVQTDPVRLPRKNVAEQHPDVSWAANCGFRAEINTLRMKPSFDLLVYAVLANESRLLLAKINGRRAALSSGFQPSMQPLIMTTLGRTGSTWLTQLLGQHPAIIAYRPFQYEPRVLTYWMEIMKTLTEPASYVQQFVPDLSNQHWWIGDQYASPGYFRKPKKDWQVERWLGKTNVEALTGFCQGQIESCYREIAALQKQREACYFTEKYAPGFDITPALIHELYPKRREIFLVRDFRDMVCSMASYSKKNADAVFFKDQVNTIEAYIPEVRNAALCLLKNWRERKAFSYLLKYEDLICHPQETLLSVLNYLDLKADSETIQMMLQKAAERVPEAQRQHQTSRSPAASIGRWKQDLDSSLYDVCQEAFRDALHEFGYEEAV